MVDFQSVMLPLSQALGLSIVVERVLEVGKNILEPRLGVQRGKAIPSTGKAAGAAKKLEKEMEADHQRQTAEKEAEAKVANRAAEVAQLRGLKDQLVKAKEDEQQTLRGQIEELEASLRDYESGGEWDERVPGSIVLVEPAKPLSQVATLKVLVMQLLGVAAGITLARFGNLELFNTFLGPDTIAAELDYILTGLFIGGGSAPVHILIRFITERKLPSPEAISDEPGEGEEAGLAASTSAYSDASVEAPAVARVSPPSVAELDWVDIPYAGGVNRERLEHTHRRTADPDMIVYHHTAMHSDSTFHDVVRVITNRTDSNGNEWTTGYNCVILASGSVHPFCRWDRFGNHAVGFNRRSLGIAFNGNFETDPSVPFSNSDGRYGITRPTEAQLRAGARVVTLWTFLYLIAIDFDDAIIPHNRISSKACPGSHFPYTEFRQLVEYYRERWKRSDAVQERIESFKRKPYLFVGEG